MSTANHPTLLQVTAWLRTRKPNLPDLDLDLDLIDNRIVDSLTFVDFLFFLEELTGRDLQDAARSIHPFRTLRSIQESILNQAA
jgi:acyl carrier protein